MDLLYLVRQSFRSFDNGFDFDVIRGQVLCEEVQKDKKRYNFTLYGHEFDADMGDVLSSYLRNAYLELSTNGSLDVSLLNIYVLPLLLKVDNQTVQDLSLMHI